MANRAKSTDDTGQGPLYELRVKGLAGGQMFMTIWQLPCLATPRLKKPECNARLKGRVLKIVETRVLRRLKATGIRLNNVAQGKTRHYPLDEDHALNLSLLFRTLAPMRNMDRIRLVAQGVDAMSREEAGYWLGMTVHRRYPRRVLAALRMLLTST